MKFKVHLSIGFVGAVHDDEIEIDDDDLASCETDDERETMIWECWQDWANNYIDGYIEAVDGDV